MDLLLWRHAEAEDGPDDLKRRLTMRGEAQATAMAHWILLQRPRNMRILVSPAVRCQQTAATLKLPYETIRGLGPDGQALTVMAESQWPYGSEAVLLVGHQPALGRFSALILSGQEANWSIKKGALWWFSSRLRNGETQPVLKCAMTPDLTR